MRRVLSNVNMLNIVYINNFGRQKGNLSSSICNPEQRIPDVDKNCHFVASILVILREGGGGRRVLSNVNMLKLFYINSFGGQKVTSAHRNIIILDCAYLTFISPKVFRRWIMRS